MTWQDATYIVDETIRKHESRISMLRRFHKADEGMKKIKRGAILLVIGLVLTCGSYYNSGGGNYYIFCMSMSSWWSDGSHKVYAPL